MGKFFHPRIQRQYIIINNWFDDENRSKSHNPHVDKIQQDNNRESNNSNIETAVTKNSKNTIFIISIGEISNMLLIRIDSSINKLDGMW